MKGRVEGGVFHIALGLDVYTALYCVVSCRTTTVLQTLHQYRNTTSTSQHYIATPHQQ